MHFKITGNLLDTISQDLARPHRFAYERVGFLLARVGNIGHETTILAYDYVSVPDEDYIEDSFVGARIGSSCIRSIMQAGIDQQCSVFHIHSHDFEKYPEFSGTDLRENSRLVQSFQNAVPTMSHGMIVLGSINVRIRVLNPKENTLCDVNRITIVDWPMTLIKY